MLIFWSRLYRPKNILIIIFSLTLTYILYALAIMESNSVKLSGKLPVMHSEDIVEEKIIELQTAPVALEKFDWHDYELINREKERKGIGERGVAASLDKSEKKSEEALYAVNGFNGALSDRISVNRSLPDIRHSLCKDIRYSAVLPSVSVVVPVHNEHWSTLLRTVHSVINRSPPSLLKEIFLVDDASTKDFLGEKLDNYLKTNAPKARVLRLQNRSGLITARLKGAHEATGDVLVFLDSHTEANVNWLPPLLEPILENYRTATCPFIDVVAYDTFEYRAQDEGARGAFDWQFYYKRLPVMPRDQLNMPNPFPSPVMAGGLFAISSKFFWELGGYDEGLDIWGGEQYELSFKIWQCGGRMLDVPCSRVGHIYRKTAPFSNPGHGDFVSKNYRRVAEVWMDEYANYLYKRKPHYKYVDPGDLTKQKALRKKLHCKSFKWFMTQIAFDLINKYPLEDPPPFASGKIRSDSERHLCIDAKNGAQMDKLHISECETGTETNFVMSWHKDIKIERRDMCWDLPESKPLSPILLYSCHLGGGNQLWRYHQDTKQLKAGAREDCLDYSSSERKVYINKCNSSPSQRWHIDHVNVEAMANWSNFKDQVTGPTEIVNER